MFIKQIERFVSCFYQFKTFCFKYFLRFVDNANVPQSLSVIVCLRHVLFMFLGGGEPIWLVVDSGHSGPTSLNSRHHL